ncbi:MAG: GTP-binding protein [Candidatus Lokiarchaeota archaeon]|nr:GTP-binding protein [Candidatus Lokiarchaeota archaeon]
MHLILSYFDKIQGPRYLIASHPHLANRIKKMVLSIMDIKEGLGFSTHTFAADKDVKLATYSFNIRSDWARGNAEYVMLTIAVDPIQSADSFARVLEKYANKIKTNRDAYKALYLNTQRIDKDIMVQYEWLDETFQNLIEDSKDVLEDVLLGQVLVLGLTKVGKTSILNRITSDIFNPNVRPTLGIQATKIMLESYKIHAFDVGGQMKLRDLWLRYPVEPQALIFVLDSSAGEEEQQATNELFKTIIEHYFTDDQKQEIIEKNIPVLILANKIDLNKECTKKDIIEILHPERFPINYKIGLTSALEAKGIYKNLRWLIAQFLNYE